MSVTKYTPWKHKIESPFPSRKEILVYQFDAWQLKVIAEHSIKENVWRKSVYFGNAEGVHIARFESLFDTIKFGSKITLAANILTEWDSSSDATEIEVWR